jgi:exopolyphosphatase/guanosine-5'-triphosphate,3'-diphosphate pyrophosphatase
MRRVAVIDLGTNTFHILIAEYINGTEVNEIYRHREYVQLAEEGIEEIGQKAIVRALETIKRFKEKLVEHHVVNFMAVGTAALREASNGLILAIEIETVLGQKIDIISGDREASLIYKGTKQVIPFNESKDLIMDIGGGSVEFIICDKNSNIWQKSFKIGVAVLFRKFHRNDPITEKEIHDIQRHLDFSLSPLIDKSRNLQINNLIGASGSFEVLESMLQLKGNKGKYTEVDPLQFKELYEIILSSNFDQRLEMDGLPETRAKLIVVAMTLMNFICKKINPSKILVSPYALKEGIIEELYF